MKKILVYGLCLTLIFTLAGCSKKKSSHKKKSGTTETVSLTKTTGKTTENTEDAKDKDSAASKQEKKKDLTGRWWDVESQRCYMEIDQKDKAIDVAVYWSSSSTEDTQWNMKGTYDEGKDAYLYKKGTKRDVIMSEDGDTESEEVVYKDGTGKIYFKDGYVYWDDDKEETRNGCKFELEKEGTYNADEEDDIADVDTVDEFDGSVPILTSSKSPQTNKTLEHHKSADGSYSDVAMRKDGYGVNFTLSMAVTPKDEETTNEKFFRNRAEYLSDGEVNDYEVTENKNYSAKLGYPVYMVTWSSGKNEDTKQWYMYSAITDSSSCFYGFSVSAEHVDEFKSTMDAAFENVNLQ